MTLDVLSDEFLSVFEIDEARLLNWGFTKTRINPLNNWQEYVERLTPLGKQLWDNERYSPDDILENLRERCLLFLVGDDEDYYRTRFAETVRLMSHLRQRFSNEDWQHAPMLVSDYRLNLRRRRYPTFTIPYKTIENYLQEQGCNQLYRDSVAALMNTHTHTPLHLAQFQFNALQQQLRDFNNRQDRGIVIGAGTGAGKTKAFYIPALSYVAEHISAKPYVKVIAIYPRVELLKDQLAEALNEAAKLNAVLRKHGKRPITIGAYYGDTPYNAAGFTRPQKDQPSNWRYNYRDESFSCPFLKAPSGQDMVWHKSNILAEIQRNKNNQYGHAAFLVDPQNPNYKVDSSALLLTREQMINEPPDILFTTTEMLNVRLSKAREHKLFGLDANTPPPALMLLDEIHTYADLNGAQVAYLLRRWQHLRRKSSNLVIVGLSATLTQAERFFATLTGIPEQRISYVTPQSNEMAERSLEYNIVLKGDPASSTALLSTSVQAAMLMGRSLDHPEKKLSRGTYGNRLFAFADNLDIINRWFRTQYDAENKTLSQYRIDLPAYREIERNQRNQLGQLWQITQAIGHNLNTPLTLDRTSSLDRGMAKDAQMVIATSTLEVGFNDPQVGAVIQHKAPRDMASFLQRKGRAGRTQQMRPWMVVVTSAYGRDRWAFQHAESLFEPHLPPIELPLQNYYVQKMQATYALLDWLTYCMKRAFRLWDADVWQALTNTDKGKQAVREPLKKVLKSLLIDPKAQQEFRDYLTKALKISDDVVLGDILWQEPRPIFMDVVPTLLRQLETNWRNLAVDNGDWQDTPHSKPLLTYLPRTLFADLNIPELIIDVPHQRPSENEPTFEEEGIDLAQGLYEFAPGKVNLRYSNRYDVHVLALPAHEQLTQGILLLNDLKAEFNILPDVTVGDTTYQVYRPTRYKLDFKPHEMRQSSTAFLKWRINIQPRASLMRSDEIIEGITVTLPQHSSWKHLVQDIRGFSRQYGTWLHVTRFAPQVDISLQYDGGTSFRRTLAIMHVSHDDDMVEAAPAAIGFELDVDGVCFKFNPAAVDALYADEGQWAQLYRTLGAAYFAHCLHQDLRLREADLTMFDINWLAQLHLSMLVATAAAKSRTLQAAAELVEKNRVGIAKRALNVIFQAIDVANQVDDPEETHGRLADRLLNYVQDNTIWAAFLEHQQVLWNRHPDGIQDWLRQIYAESLGASLYTTVIRLLPDIAPEDVLLDIVDDTIWITEAKAGGVGIIAKVLTILQNQPRQFSMQLTDVVEYCDRAALANQLHHIAALATEPDLQSIFTSLRTQYDLQDVIKTYDQLQAHLERQGIPATRSLMVALNAKFLRPNSNFHTDRLLADLSAWWQAQQEELGIQIDLRVLAVAAVQNDDISRQLDHVLQSLGLENAATEDLKFNLLQSLLWLDCTDSCPNCIETNHRYQPIEQPSRAILQALLQSNKRGIRFNHDNWQEIVRMNLEHYAVATITCRQDQLVACKQDLLHRVTTPLEWGDQLLYPCVEHIVREGLEWHITLILPERMTS